jgi:hypothetical protein
MHNTEIIWPSVRILFSETTDGIAILFGMGESRSCGMNVILVRFGEMWSILYIKLKLSMDFPWNATSHAKLFEIYKQVK